VPKADDLSVDHAITFARHFSRLVWLLIHQPESVDEQKAALRALVTVSKQGGVTLAVQDGQLTVNGAPLPPALTGVQELRSQFVGHDVAQMAADVGAIPADILGTARVIASVPVSGDEGRQIRSKLRELAPRSVRVTFKREAAEADPIIVRAFTTVDRAQDSSDDLIDALKAATSVAMATRALDQIAGVVETQARSNKVVMVAGLMSSLVTGEASQADPDMKLAYGAAIRRLSKPTILRAVASVLPRRKERTDDYVLVLMRTGDAGAEALIEQLTAAQSLSERRVFFDALVQLKTGKPMLVHMLGDPRWYVARNAADLLGELGAADADEKLSELLKHDDDRVRRAAAHALGKLGTRHSVVALRRALKDSSVHVRALAAAGLANRKGAPSSTTLVKALDGETEQEVQIAILGALGRVGTPEAVQRLIKAAEPAGNLFKRKPAALRVAAVQALGEARTPAALAVLKDLSADKDKDVREAAARALAHTDRPEPTTLA
jgi:HEAT repeat protein